MEKEFLSQKSVAFVEQDIGADAEAMEELVNLGVLTTPVALVDGELVVGFDRKKLERLLSL